MKRLVALLISLLASAIPTYGQEEGHRFRVGICDWTIKMSLSEEAFQFAKRNGLQGVQYSFGAEGDRIDLRTLENREKLREIVQRTGVGVSSLGIGLLNKIPLATTSESDEIVMACLESMIALKKEAAELDDPKLAAKVSPNIVLLAFFGKADLNGDPERIATVIRKLKRFAPIAEEHGFILGIESLLNEADHRHIIEQVGSTAVQVYYDTANSARMGYDIYSEIESLGAKQICEIHIKENGDLIGKGSIDFGRVKSLLTKMDYQGWLIVEGSVPKGMDRVQASVLNSKIAMNLFNNSIEK